MKVNIKNLLTKTGKKYVKGKGKYKFMMVQGKKTEIPGYMFVKGKLKGLVFQFADVKVEEEKDETGTYPLKMDFIILANPTGIPADSKFLENNVRNVAMWLLEEQLKDGELITKKDIEEINKTTIKATDEDIN